MMHPWMRLPDVANMLGLTLGSLAIFITGLQLNNIYIKIISILSGCFFFLLFIIYLTLCIVDYVELYPDLTKGFWIFRY